MADTDNTVVYPKPGVTLFLPGGVHGFTTAHGSGVPMPNVHAAPLVAAGHLDTDATREKAAELAAAVAQETAAKAAEQQAAEVVEHVAGAAPGAAPGG